MKARVGRIKLVECIYDSLLVVGKVRVGLNIIHDCLHYVNYTLVRVPFFESSVKIIYHLSILAIFFKHDNLKALTKKDVLLRNIVNDG